MIGIFAASAAFRITTSCSRGIFPLGVLMMKLISPFLIRSSTLGRPSSILNTFVTLIFALVSASAVPLVEMISKPSFRNSRATGMIASLSASLTLMKTLPALGSGGWRSHLGFGIRKAKIDIDPHDFSGRFHFRP